jgi:hypothetical protein
MLLGTMYLYAVVHNSALMAKTCPYGVRAVFKIWSGVSGGKLATRTRLNPIPPMSSETYETSPVACLHGTRPEVSCKILVTAC